MPLFHDLHDTAWHTYYDWYDHMLTHLFSHHFVIFNRFSAKSPGGAAPCLLRLESRWLAQQKPSTQCATWTNTHTTYIWRAKGTWMLWWWLDIEKSALSVCEETRLNDIQWIQHFCVKRRAAPGAGPPCRSRGVAPGAPGAAHSLHSSKCVGRHGCNTLPVTAVTRGHERFLLRLHSQQSRIPASV